MRWKLHCPHPPGSEERMVLEDLYLLPEDGRNGGRSYWVTVEGLQSFTGGTREEKLERLAGKEFDISDTMDMLVNREDFSRPELLSWVRLFIQSRFGDHHPELVEAEGHEIARTVPVIRENDTGDRDGRPARLLFIHHQVGPPQPVPEQILKERAGLEVTTLRLDDLQTAQLPAEVIAQADLVFVMDKRTRASLHRRCKALGVDRRFICLFLPEYHDVRDQTYLELFRERVQVYLDRFGWSRDRRE